MKVILKEDDEAYEMLKADIKQLFKSAVKEVIEEAKGVVSGSPNNELWCDTRRAQEILGVRKTKMQQLRDGSPQNGIIMSKEGRTIRYEIASLYAYLNKNIIK